MNRNFSVSVELSMAATSESMRKSLSIRNSQFNDGDRKINRKEHNRKISAMID